MRLGRSQQLRWHCCADGVPQRVILGAEEVFTTSICNCLIAALFASLWFYKSQRGPFGALMRLTTEGKVR